MKIRVLFILGLFVFSAMSMARTDCPVTKVEHIQIEGSVVLYRQNGYWRRLGRLEEPGTKERYSAMLSAHMAGKPVMVAYLQDEFNCNESNYITSAHIVRTYQ